ncbi:MAG: hypothetical protein ABI843_05630 [Dokdonella sp.]
MSLIELRNVEKSFPLAGRRLWVLRTIDLDITECEFVGVLGPSGTGSQRRLCAMNDPEFR